jgi:hypothetical protein
MAGKSSWDQANRLQKLGLVLRIRKTISQITKDYFYLLFFLLIILWHCYCVSWVQGVGVDWPIFDDHKERAGIHPWLTLILSPEPCKAQFLVKNNQTLLFRADMVSGNCYANQVTDSYPVLKACPKRFIFWAALMGQSQEIVS